MKSYIDLSHPFNNHMPFYPGDETPRLERVSDFAADGHCDFRLTSTMHAGTHIDGPMHLTTSRQFIGDISIDRFVGTGCLLNVAGEKNITRKTDFESRIIPDTIVVIYTGFGEKYGSEEYYTKHPVISIELAELFVERRLKMICIDAPSPDYPPFPVHNMLLKNRIFIAENVTNLKKLTQVKSFEVIALPLRFHADSSPSRIIAKIFE